MTDADRQFCPYLLKAERIIGLLMIEWTSFFAGACQLLNLQIILLMIAGIFFGILCGAIPGFSASMAVVVVLPLTFSMEPLVAMVFLCSIYVAAVYGGSITAILINTPGTANSAATSFDGYPMTLQGRAGEALGLSIGASCIGGVISYGFMLVLMYPIAAFAVKFGSAEMFLLAVFGLTIIGGISEGGLSKALLAGLFGVIVSTVGISPAGSIRGHFGSPWLLDGLPTVPTIIGFFALSEMFNMLNKDFVVEGTNVKRSVKEIVKGTLKPLKSPGNLFRSSLIGTFIGAVPAAGGTIASFISYNQAKQASKDPDSFGKGNPEGVIASESSNNASTGGALITMFALGIPGSSTTAIMMSALMIQGLQDVYKRQVYGGDVPEGYIPNELGVLLTVTADDQETATKIAKVFNPILLHFEVAKNTPKPSFAFPFSPAEVEKGRIYEFQLNHVIELDDPFELIRMEYVTIDGKEE